MKFSIALCAAITTIVVLSVFFHVGDPWLEIIGIILGAIVGVFMVMEDKK